MSLNAPGPYGPHKSASVPQHAAPRVPRKAPADGARKSQERKSPEEVEAGIDSNQLDPARPRKHDEAPAKPAKQDEPSEEEVRPHDPPPMPSQHDPAQPASPEPMRPGRDPTRRHTPDKA